MYLAMDINTTLFRQRLLESGFNKDIVEKIMNICYSSEIQPNIFDEDD